MPLDAVDNQAKPAQPLPNFNWRAGPPFLYLAYGPPRNLQEPTSEGALSHGSGRNGAVGRCGDPNNNQVCYSFGGGKADGNGKMKDVLGGKGAGLAEMTNAGLPVLPDSPSRPRPAANICAQTEPQIETEMLDALEKLEKLQGQKLAWAKIRCWSQSARAPKFSCPAIMDTI